jgi:site-specific recombinase XerD
MQNTALPFHVSVSLAQFKRAARGWLLDADIERLSPNTIAKREIVVKNFVWFCEREKIDCIDAMTFREFLKYVSHGHEEPGGRWGNPQQNRPVKPATPAMYHCELRALANWMVANDVVPASPMKAIKAPVDRRDQIVPFTDEQIMALIRTAKASPNPVRDEAICWLLLDSGLRVSELCSLKMKDVDFDTRSVRAERKGGKAQTLPIGRTATKALWNLLRKGHKADDEERDPDEFVFVSDRGRTKGEALTRSGVLQLVHRLADEAGIKNVRASPHTFRHTYAISFLRNGGNQFTLMTLLGHTNLKQTNLYVQIAQADMAGQHRKFSPADTLKRKKTR